MNGVANHRSQLHLNYVYQHHGKKLKKNDYVHMHFCGNIGI